MTSKVCKCLLYFGSKKLTVKYSLSSINSAVYLDGCIYRVTVLYFFPVLPKYFQGYSMTRGQALNFSCCLPLLPPIHCQNVKRFCTLFSKFHVHSSFSNSPIIKLYLLFKNSFYEVGCKYFNGLANIWKIFFRDMHIHIVKQIINL